MRKRIIGPTVPASGSSPKWMDLEEMATIEVTSEAPGFPVESVFVPGSNNGWRATVAGKQTLRVIVDEPTSVRAIELHFAEVGWSALRSSGSAGLPWKAVQRTKS